MITVSMSGNVYARKLSLLKLNVLAWADSVILMIYYFIIRMKLKYWTNIVNWTKSDILSCKKYFSELNKMDYWRMFYKKTFQSFYKMSFQSKSHIKVSV